MSLECKNNLNLKKVSVYVIFVEKTLFKLKI